MEQTKGSLKNFFYDKEYILGKTVFCSFTEQSFTDPCSRWYSEKVYGFVKRMRQMRADRSGLCPYSSTGIM